MKKPLICVFLSCNKDNDVVRGKCINYERTLDIYIVNYATKIMTLCVGNAYIMKELLIFILLIMQQR